MEPVSHVTRLSMPLEPSLYTMPPSFALSQLHTICVAQLLQTPLLIYQRCAQLNLHPCMIIQRRCLFFVPSIMHNHTGAAYSPNGFTQVVMTRDQIWDTQMRERESDLSVKVLLVMRRRKECKHVSLSIHTHIYIWQRKACNVIGICLLLWKNHDIVLRS